MRIRGAATVVLSTLGLAAGNVAAADAAVLPGPAYYVALGDSLSQGYQPGLGDTDQGYVDFLYARLKARTPRLRLVKLGCSGETTTTLLQGGRCSYRNAASQLQAATRFLLAHRGQVRYVTLDIGGNDVNRCAPGGSIDVGCVLAGLGTVGANLPRITTAVRRAAGPRARLLAANYHDPYLAAWLTGPDGQDLARLSVVLTHGLNGLESTIYRASGYRVADVAGAFATDDFAGQEVLPGVGQVPRNVYRICAWTYMCVRSDIHPNTAGYQVIAQTLARVAF